MNWKISTDLTAISQGLHITLQGIHLNITADFNGNIPPRTSFMNIQWLLHRVKDYTFDFDDWKSCLTSYEHNFHCLNITIIQPNNTKILYTVAGNHKAHEYRDPYKLAEGHEIYQRSWDQSFKLCKGLGGDLPIFISSYELDIFITLLQKSRYLPFIEAIYIGLSYNWTQVGFEVYINLNRNLNYCYTHPTICSAS